MSMNGQLVSESAQSFPEPSRPPPLRAPANRTAALENEPLAIFDHHRLPATHAHLSEHCSLRCLNHSNRYVARVIAGFKARAIQGFIVSGAQPTFEPSSGPGPGVGLGQSCPAAQHITRVAQRPNDYRLEVTCCYYLSNEERHVNFPPNTTSMSNSFAFTAEGWPFCSLEYKQVGRRRSSLLHVPLRDMVE
jgi:hypothetical protein